MLLLSGHFGFIVPIIILYNRAYAFSHNTAPSVFNKLTNKLTLVLLVKIKFANKNNDCCIHAICHPAKKPYPISLLNSP